MNFDHNGKKYTKILLRQAKSMLNDLIDVFDKYRKEYKGSGTE